jgi:hypothetical protein
LKRSLAGKSFKTTEELRDCIEALINDIEPKIFTKVFKNWIERLDFIIDSGGKYFNKKFEVFF